MLEGLLQPFPLLLLAIALALANLWRKRRETRRRLLCLTLVFVGFSLFCMPAVSYLGLGSLEWQYPPLRERPEGIEAIVVLSAGVSPPDTIRDRAEMDRSTMLRCLKAAEMYQRGKPCWVLATGGAGHEPHTGPPFAEVMRDYLIQLQVDPHYIWVEPNSHSTYENALESRKLLEAQGVHRILLVTDAAHLMRAEYCFRNQGFETVPCGCHYRSTPSAEGRCNFVPSPGGGHDATVAVHEWVGMAWYWLRDKL